MSFRGIDIRQSSDGGADRLVFRVSLKDATGNKVTGGTTAMALYELQQDGTLKSYDFADNTFKAGALGVPTVTLTHQSGNNSTTNTGIWTCALTTLTGFTVGNVYIIQVSNASASPVDQERQFQYGGSSGDGQLDAAGYYKLSVGSGTGQLAVASGTVASNVAQWAGTAVPAPSVAGVPTVDIAYVGGQVARNFDGKAQGGTSTTIALDPAESAAGNTLVGRRITIVGGAGSGQSRFITAYGGPPARQATVHRDWDVTPDATSQYILDSTAEADAMAIEHQALSSQVGINFNTFFQNAGGATSRIVDDVGSAAGGTADWTTTERAQIRYRLGLDGNAQPPVSATTGLGPVDAHVVSMATDAVDANALAASAVTEIQSGLATGLTLAGVGNAVATILTQTGTVGVKVADKTGYSLAASEHAAVQVDVASALNTAIPATPLANSVYDRLDAKVSSRLAVGTAPANWGALRVSVDGYVGIDLNALKPAAAPTTLANITVPSVISVADKAGYSLAPTGLDAIAVTDPGGVATMNTLPKLIVALWRRYFKKSSLSVAAGLQTYADDGVTVNTTQSLADDGTIQTMGAAR